MKRKIFENKFIQVYKADEPENFGSLPIRQEIEVLSTNQINSSKLGWKVLDSSDDPITDPLTGNRIAHLHLNQEVSVVTLLGTITMKITELFKCRAKAETEKSVNYLYLDQKEKFWRSEPLLINKKILSKCKLF